MLFTWDTNNLCIVFRQWHIRSTTGLIISLLAVVALAAGYEALREASRRYEASTTKRVEALPSKLVPIRSSLYTCLEYNVRLLLFVKTCAPTLPRCHNIMNAKSQSRRWKRY
jgi:hypothetical protein